MSSTGQARKSLWIETLLNGAEREGIWVRLVRACGSKQQCGLYGYDVFWSGS